MSGSGKGKKSLEASLVAAKQAFRLQRLQIEPVEEWPISVGRRAGSGKVDRITVLPNHPGAVRELASHRTAGVGIVLVRGEIPEQPRLALLIIYADDKRPSPVAVVIVFIHERDAGLFAPGEADITLLRARDFDCRRAERRLLKQNLVASRNLHIPVAAIQRFGPDQRRRIGGTPGKIAGPGGNSVNRDPVRQWKRRDGMRKNMGGLGYVPDLDFLREAIVGCDIGIRLVDRSDQDVLPVWRGI